MENYKIPVEEWKNFIPKGWKILGDIACLKNYPIELFNSNKISKKSQECLGFAFSNVLQVRCVVGFSSGISGELRTPTSDNIHKIYLGSDYNLSKSSFIDKSNILETIHQENNIYFCLDVSKVMFSPGNGTERLRSKSYFTLYPLEEQKEIVLDMFSGIGYFSLPMAVCGNKNIEKLICLEKNPDSVSYLKRNFIINNVDENLYEIHCGDNREEGNHWLGKVRRISMGYLPDTYPFLPRGFAFLKRDCYCMIHYHYLYDNKSGEQTAKEHFDDAIEKFTNENLNVKVNYSIECITIVKPYAPKVYHAVADIKINIITK